MVSQFNTFISGGYFFNSSLQLMYMPIGICSNLQVAQKSLESTHCILEVVS